MSAYRELAEPAHVTKLRDEIAALERDVEAYRDMLRDRQARLDRIARWADRVRRAGWLLAGYVIGTLISSLLL